MTGRIVLLNGASSSGKTTLARELLATLPGTWFHIAVDDVHAMRARRGFPSEEVLRRSRAGYHRMVAGMAEAGNDVVADHVLSEPWRLADCLEVWAAHDVLCVGVHCDPAELARRELARGDRPAGLAAEQATLVHRDVVYDLEVDTGRSTARECAAVVAALLADPPTGPAFHRMGQVRG